MRSYQKIFHFRMAELVPKPKDFESVVRYSLRKILGESSSEVLFMTLGRRAFEDPRIFEAAVTRMFGTGAESICRSIESYAAEGSWSARVEGVYEATHEALASDILSANRFRKKEETKRSVILHDQRIKDEFGQYSSDAY
jgi:hypothetical protein